MNWYSGEVGAAIQKAIGEKKVFIVFVKDEGEDSKVMEEIWNEPEVTMVCTDDKCVAINITAESVSGQQFGAIYPILVVPSTYLINNQGVPTDIVPGIAEKEEFVKRISDAIEKTLGEVPVSVSTDVEMVESSATSLGEGASDDDLESDLTPLEVDQIAMLREKVSSALLKLILQS